MKLQCLPFLLLLRIQCAHCFLTAPKRRALKYRDGQSLQQPLQYPKPRLPRNIPLSASFPIADALPVSPTQFSTYCLISSSIPLLYSMFCFARSYLPQSVVIGYLLGAVVSPFAGYAEFVSQSMYQQAFSDTDWIHGTYSASVALCATIVLRGVLIDGDSVLATRNDNSGALLSLSPASKWTGTLFLLLPLSIGILHAWQGAAAHTSFLWVDFASKSTEPPNALSTSTWLFHALDLVVNRQLAVLWGRRCQPGLAASHWLMAYALAAAMTWHMGYNSNETLFGIFGFLLLLQSIGQARAAAGVVGEREKAAGISEGGEKGIVANLQGSSEVWTSVLATTIGVGVLLKVASVSGVSGNFLSTPSSGSLLGVVLLVVAWTVITVDWKEQQSTFP